MGVSEDLYFIKGLRKFYFTDIQSKSIYLYVDYSLLAKLLNAPK